MEVLPQTIYLGSCFVNAIYVFFILLLYCIFQVLAAVIRNKKLKSVTNILVCNLASTDILFAAGIPFIAVTRITQNWILGDVICKLVTYVQFVSGVCSIVTMVMISVERYICVCLINKHKLTFKDTAIVLAAIWLLAILFPIPVALSQTVMTFNLDDETYRFCGVQWLDNFHADVYLSFMIGVFFFIPLMVISGFYLQILRTVTNSSARTNGTSTLRSELSAKKQIRLVKMFASIVALFVIMWLPFFILSFLGVHYKQITSTHFTATLILALANTCQNPLLYGYFNHHLREEFRTMLFRRCFRGDNCLRSTAYNVQGTELGSTGNNSSTVG